MNIDCTFIPTKSSTEPSKIRLNCSHHIFGYDVPAGFESDGGSIPRPASLFIDRWGEALECFILHDYLLGLAKDEDYVFADRKLYEHCLHIGVNKYRAKAIYRGVRIGSWRRKR